MCFCHVMSRYEGKTKIIITPKDRITKIILFSIKHNMGYGESGKLNRWPWCETSLTCPLSVTGRTSFALKYIDIHSWKNDNSHVCHLVGVEDDGLLRVVLLHHLDGDPGDGGLEVGLLSVHHAPRVQLPGSLDTGHVTQLYTWHLGSTCSRVLRRPMQFPNCSSYSSVSAELRGSMRPIFSFF